MARIVRILEIKDTRDYREQGDRWVPVPGSGKARECDRCGRLHEVHATVLLDDESTIVVGTGCAARESSDLAPRFKRADSIAKRLAHLRAHAADLQAKADAYDDAKAEVSRLIKPEAILTIEGDRCYVQIGDARGCVFLSQSEADNRFHVEAKARDVALMWERNRLADLGCGDAHRRARTELEEIQIKIQKNEKALADLLTA